MKRLFVFFFAGVISSSVCTNVLRKTQLENEAHLDITRFLCFGLRSHRGDTIHCVGM